MHGGYSTAPATERMQAPNFGRRVLGQLPAGVLLCQSRKTFRIQRHLRPSFCLCKWQKVHGAKASVLRECRFQAPRLLRAGLVQQTLQRLWAEARRGAELPAQHEGLDRGVAAALGLCNGHVWEEDLELRVRTQSPLGRPQGWCIAHRRAPSHWRRGCGGLEIPYGHAKHIA